MKRSFSAVCGDVPGIDDVRHFIEKRLFVGRLPPEVTEQDLRDLFTAFGTLTECRLLIGKASAFIGFSSWGSAHRALTATDDQVFPGRPGQGDLLHVSFAERSGAGRGVGKPFAKGLEHNRLFVGGLPDFIMDADLRQIFEQCGRVEEVQMLPPKGHKRCGFVRYGFWGEALDAIETLDGQRMPMGTSGAQIGPLTVVFAVPPGGDGTLKRSRWSNDPMWDGTSQEHWAVSAGPPAAGPSGGTVQEWETLKAAYMAAIESETPDKVCDELHRKIMAARMAQKLAYAAPIQTLVPAAVRVLGAGGGGGGGSGFPGGGLGYTNNDENFVPPEVWSCSGQIVDDKDSCRLFVGALPVECTDEEFLALVNQVSFPGLAREACQVLECRVLPGRGCGYIRFSSWEAAAEALSVLHERSVSGWPHPLRVRWAMPKSGASSGGGIGGGGGPDRGGLALDSVRAVAVNQAMQGMMTRNNGCSAGLGSSSASSLGGGGGFSGGLGGGGGGLGANMAGGLGGGQSGGLSGGFGGGVGGGFGGGGLGGGGLGGLGSSGGLGGGGLGGGGLGGGSLGGVLGDGDLGGGGNDEGSLLAQGLDPRRLFVGQIARELADQSHLVQIFEAFGQVEHVRLLAEKGVAYISFVDFASAKMAMEALKHKHFPGVSREGGLNINFSRTR